MKRKFLLCVFCYSCVLGFIFLYKATVISGPVHICSGPPFPQLSLWKWYADLYTYTFLNFLYFVIKSVFGTIRTHLTDKEPPPPPPPVEVQCLCIYLSVCVYVYLLIYIKVKIWRTPLVAHGCDSSTVRLRVAWPSQWDLASKKLEKHWSLPTARLLWMLFGPAPVQRALDSYPGWRTQRLVK